MTDNIQNKLVEILSDEQVAQLARLLAPVMAHGWGTVTIEVTQHQVRFIRQQLSFAVEMEVVNGRDAGS